LDLLAEPWDEEFGASESREDFPAKADNLELDDFNVGFDLLPRNRI
jgi:hypothetical protein